MGFVESLIQMAESGRLVRDFPTLCRRQARLAMQSPYRASGQPLNLLIASRDIALQCTAGQWTALVSGSVAMVSGWPASVERRAAGNGGT